MPLLSRIDPDLFSKRVFTSNRRDIIFEGIPIDVIIAFNPLTTIVTHHIETSQLSCMKLELCLSHCFK